MSPASDPAIASAEGRLAQGLRPRDRPADLVSRPGGLGLSSPIIIPAVLAVADGVAAQVALRLAAWVHAALDGGGLASRPLDPLLVAGALALPIGYYLLGVYSAHDRAPIEQFPLRIKATCLLFGLLLAWCYSMRGPQWPGAAVLGLAFLMMLVLSPLGEDLVRSLLIRCGLWGVPAVVIGIGPLGQQVVRVLRQMPELGLRPVAVFDDSRPGPDAAQQDVPVLGSIADSAMYSGRIHTAIVTTPPATQETIGAVAMRLGYRDIIVIPDLRDLPTLWVGARDFSGMIGLRLRRNLLLRRNRLMKQAIDYALGVPLLVVSVPIIMGLAIWVVLESRGWPFYCQLRPGKDGHPIKVWKLRTMYPDAEIRLQRLLSESPVAREEWDRFCKLTNDPRVLPRVGTFLRRASLDELPQIFNVVRGELSLVGPRPFPSYHLARFDRDFQLLRASVVPGITGLWQISARSDGDLAVQRALDTFYIRNWSIWIDIFILFRTVGAVLGGRGAR